MKKHTIFDGVGIFAGRDYKQGEVVERSITITLPAEKNTPILSHYVFSHENNTLDLVLGYAMIYNHRNNNSLTVQAQLSPSPRVGLPAPSNNINDFLVVANYDIMKGQEMFTSYGDEQWFIENEIDFIDHSIDSTGSAIADQSIIMPGCPMSKTEIINGKVYATQFIAAREVIEISRALFVPIDTGDGNDLESYLWYSEYSNERALLLLGQGALYNTLPREQLEESTVDYTWYDLDQLDANETRNINGTNTKDKNIICGDSMLVELKARRDILPNEELTVALNIYENTKRRFVLPHWLELNCF